MFVGLGFPKQERLIVALHDRLPAAWWLGCGAAIPFAAGAARRTPGWMGLLGLEWLYRLVHEPRRLVHEPRRLVRRYLWEDAPYALALLLRAASSGLGERLPPRRPAHVVRELGTDLSRRLTSLHRAPGPRRDR